MAHPESIENHENVEPEVLPMTPIGDFVTGEEVEPFVCRCGTTFDRTVVIAGPARLGSKLCPTCEAEEQEAQRAHIEALSTDARRSPLGTLAAIGVNVRVFGHITLEQIGPSADAARGFARDVLKAKPYDFVQGLYLAGPTGTGKTQLAISTLRAVLEWGYQGRIVFDRARALITTIQDRYGTGTVDAVIDARRTAGVWLLDDIGTEKPTSDALRIIEDILDARQGHPTILTSNESPAGLAQRWATADVQGRFASRIGPRNYRAVVLDGEDRRFAA